MIYRHFLYLMLSLLLLSGCATTENYERLLQSWVGAYADNLVEYWGVPDRTYEGEEFTYYAYTYSYDSYIPASPPEVLVGRHGGVLFMHQYGGMGGYSVNYYCEATFKVDRATKTVVGWSYRGNNCRVTEETLR